MPIFKNVLKTSKKTLKYLISSLISKYKVAADEMDIDLGYVLEIAFGILMN